MSINETNERGFYIVITQDRSSDLNKFLKFLLKFNDYPVYIVVAHDKLDAHRKKTMVGFLSPFKTSVLLDTDILVNGNLDYLFEIAESGKIAILDEGIKYYAAPVLNAGVIAFPSSFVEALSSLWFYNYEEYIKLEKHRVRGTYDQAVLNDILHKNPSLFPYFPIPSEYNFILKFHTSEEESQNFSNIKIFHFLHDNDPRYPCDKNKFKSYQVYNS